MAIVQVKDAEGSVLDWMVASCENTLGRYVQPNEKRGTTKWEVIPQTLHYSTNWVHCGPIIDREKIATSPLTDGTWTAYAPNGTRWIPRNQSGVEVYNWEFKQTGSTPLIAAMRCYVYSVLGHEVEVPDELI